MDGVLGVSMEELVRECDLLGAAPDGLGEVEETDADVDAVRAKDRLERRDGGGFAVDDESAEERGRLVVVRVRHGLAQEAEDQVVRLPRPPAHQHQAHAHWLAVHLGVDAVHLQWETCWNTIEYPKSSTSR